jgi:xylulokinase
VRAILESTAESLAALVRRLSSTTGRPVRILATGGGARSDLWLQIKADRLGTEMVRTACPEPACRGAAMLAAVGYGWYDRLSDVSAAWTSVEHTFSPKS